MKRLFAIAASALLLFGCPPPPPPAWYTGAEPVLIDTAALYEKVIVIDPGHGGTYDGAIGKGGVREKDLNLQVAWRLLFLLDSLGAQPILTRSYDRDFLPDTAGARNLRADLNERMRRANQAAADLFVSIHHNATENRTINDTKTFYSLGDPGASFEAAGFIHRAFVRNLGIEPEEVLPGNYFVLRNSKAPALLGEPSYISNPAQESILATSQAVDVEARAYVQGIAQFFSSGAVRVTRIIPSDKRIPYATPLFVARLEGSPLRFEQSGVLCVIDSMPTKPAVDGSTLTFRAPALLSNGWHTASVQVVSRSLASSTMKTVRFKIDLPPADMKITADPPVFRNKQWVRVTADVTDSLHRAVADSCSVWFRASRGSFLFDSVMTFQGRATNFWKRDSAGPVRVGVFCNSLAESLDVPFADDRRFYSGFLRNSFTKGGIADAAVLSKDGVPQNQTDPYGFYSLPVDQGKPLFSKAGYRNTECSAESSQTFMTPFHKGALLGKKILLDPEYGGEQSGPKSPARLRAADLNVRFGLRLAKFLRAAGAQVTWTRKDNRSRTPYQRVEVSLSDQFDVAISIGHDSTTDQACRIYHYASSEPAKQIAAALSRAAVPLLGKTRCKGPIPYSSTFLQQTPCPALRISPTGIADPDTSMEFGEYAAYAISSGLALSFQRGPDFRVIRIGLPDSVQEQQPCWASVDGGPLLPVSPQAPILRQDLENGLHALEVFGGQEAIWERRFSVLPNGKVRFE